MCLESSVSELGGSVDELEVDLLQSAAAGARVHALAQSQDALVDTNSAALEHQVVVLDEAVVREASQRVDALLGQIVRGRRVVCDKLAVNLVLKGFRTQNIKCSNKRSPCRCGRSSC